MNHSENDQSNLQKIIDEIQKKILITTDVKKCVSEIINDLFKNRETNRLSNDPINFCHNQTKRSIDFNTNQIDENQFNNFPYSGSSTDYDPCLSDRLTDNPSYLQDSMISSDSPLSDDTMMPEKIVELLVQSFLDTEFYVHKLAVIYIIFSNVKVHKKGFWHTENIKDIFLTLLKDNIQLLARTVIEQACDFFIKNWDEILHFSRTFNKCDSEDHDSIEKQPLMIICQKLLDDDLFEYITFLKGKNDYLQAGVGDLFCLLHKYLEYGQYLPNFKFNKIKEKILDLLKRFIKWPYIRVKHAIILRMKDMPLFYNTIMEVLIHETNSLLIINLIKNLNDYHLLHFLKECKVVRLEIIDEINKRIEGGFSFLLKEKMIREKTFEYKKIENKLFDINSLQEKEDDDEFRRNLGMKSPTELKTNLFDILESDPSIEVKFKVLNMLKNPNLICLFCGDKNWRKRKRALEILLEFLQKTSILDKKEKKKNITFFKDVDNLNSVHGTKTDDLSFEKIDDLFPDSSEEKWITKENQQSNTSKSNILIKENQQSNTSKSNILIKENQQSNTSKSNILIKNNYVRYTERQNMSQNEIKQLRKKFINIYIEFLEDPVAEIRNFASKSFHISFLSSQEQQLFFRLISEFYKRVHNNFRLRVSLIPLVVNCYAHLIDTSPDIAAHQEMNSQECNSDTPNNSDDSIKSEETLGMSNFSLSQPVKSSIEHTHDENGTPKSHLSFLEMVLQKMRSDPVENVREKLESVVRACEETM